MHTVPRAAQRGKYHQRKRTINRKESDDIRNACGGRGRCHEQHKQHRGAAIDELPPQLICRIQHRITHVRRLHWTQARARNSDVPCARATSEMRAATLACSVSSVVITCSVSSSIVSTRRAPFAPAARTTRDPQKITGHVSLKHIRCS
jgi:hypothetical protein